MNSYFRATALVLSLVCGGTLARAAGPPLDRVLKGQPLLDDLTQFRGLLKTEWILANLTDADFDSAVDAVAKDAPAGMTAAELTFRLQRVLALGADGHAMIGQFTEAVATIPGPRPDFLIDITGDGYTAYRIESEPLGRVNADERHRFYPLKAGYPHLLAIDGVPMAKWVEAAGAYVCRRPGSGRRWRAMRILQDLPFVRRELGLPNPPTIRVTLASADRKSEVEIDAPTIKFQRFHFPVPKPDSRTTDDNIGYVWISDPSSHGAGVMVREMPKLKGTRGLILDLRDNEGGAGLDTLQLAAAYLLPRDRPRRAVGEIVHWQGDGWATNTGEVATDHKGLSAGGRQVVADFQKAIKRTWQPPKSRATESRTIFLARPEAEPTLFPYNHERFPKTHAYTAPVVVLFNHRCFSAAEIFLAGIRDVGGVTLVGNAPTAGGAGSGKWHSLTNSGLKVVLANQAFVRADGTLIDGKGVEPDVVAELDADYYLGGRDRMLEKAIEVLKAKIAARK